MVVRDDRLFPRSLEAVEDPAEDLALERLRAHALRRARGIPTLSVLVGEPAASTELWSRWARSASLAVRATGLDSDVLSGANDLTTPARLESGFVPRPLRSEGPPRQQEPPDHVEPTADLVVLPAPGPRDLALAFAALERDPSRHLAILVDAPAAGRLRDAPVWDRPHTLFREGMLRVPRKRDPSSRGPAVDGVDSSAKREPGASPRVFAGDVRWTARVRELRELCEKRDGEQEDRARSEAERILFEALERDDVTRGRFELNAQPGFRFGSRRAEIDLLAGDAKLAIEVDGYFHFRDAEDYRRDRRKDVLLQRHEYLVMRFLAEDIARDLDEIVARIRSATVERSR